MGQKPARSMLTMLAVVLIAACLTPAAMAGQVTKIAYGSVDVDMWKITSGSYSGGVFAPAANRPAIHVSIGWDLGGSPKYGTVWPAQRLIGLCQYTKAGKLYSEDWPDSDPPNWGGNDNPQWWDYSPGGTLAADGADSYVSVMSAVGESVPYTFDISCDKAFQVTSPSGTVTTVGTVTTLPASPAHNTPDATHHAAAYNFTDSPETSSSFSGEVDVPEEGTWVSTPQYWPGTTAMYYTQWQDHVTARGTGSADVLADNRGTYDPTMWYPTGRLGVSTKTIPIGGASPATPGWYVFWPLAWGAAKAPNNWPAGGPMPEPGSLPLGANGANSSAMYYTYSFPDSYYDDTAKNGATWSTLGYMLAPGGAAAASKRGYQIDTTTGATITYRFAGTSVQWFYQTNSFGVKVDVLIDGVAPAANSVVDQSSASTAYASKTYGGLGAGNHVITLTSSGLAGANHIAWPTAKTMTHDKFVAATDWGGVTDPTPDAEDSYDGMTTCRWGAKLSAGAHGGSYGATTSTKAAVAFSFSGTAFDIIYTASNVGGRVNVMIDGVAQPPLDQSAAATAYQQVKSYSSLAAGWHQVLVTSSGVAGVAHVPSPTNKLYTIDAFRVGSTYYEN